MEQIIEKVASVLQRVEKSDGCIHQLTLEDLQFTPIHILKTKIQSVYVTESWQFLNEYKVFTVKVDILRPM